MSGIAGVFFPEGRPVGRAALERMMARLAHRGPDGQGIWNEGATGLGHRALWTTPESRQEKLPLASQRGELVLTADARIDNRAELIASMALTGYAPAELTDSQLILATYETWGERCPEKLLGDFAFVIWDKPRQMLFCARDHLGVKPYYYHHSPRAFVFASEIKAVLSLSEVPCQLNEVKIADHLVAMFDDRTITFYRDIFRLPAAHSMTVSREGIRTRPYWSLDPARELRLRSDEEYAQGFRELFTEAVACRLRSAFPIGSLLSGGLDSSSIVCTARNLLGQKGDRRLHTFSAVFPSLPEADLRTIDERTFIHHTRGSGDGGSCIALRPRRPFEPLDRCRPGPLARR